MSRTEEISKAGKFPAAALPSDNPEGCLSRPIRQPASALSRSFIPGIPASLADNPESRLFPVPEVAGDRLFAERLGSHEVHPALLGKKVEVLP